MAAQLDIDLRPEAALTDATRATQRLYARLAYTRHVLDEDNTIRVPATITVELDAEGIAQFTVKDGAAESPAELKVETAQGVGVAARWVPWTATRRFRRPATTCAMRRPICPTPPA